MQPGQSIATAISRFRNGERTSLPPKFWWQESNSRTSSQLLSPYHARSPGKSRDSRCADQDSLDLSIDELDSYTENISNQTDESADVTLSIDERWKTSPQLGDQRHVEANLPRTRPSHERRTPKQVESSQSPSKGVYREVYKKLKNMSDAELNRHLASIKDRQQRRATRAGTDQGRITSKTAKSDPLSLVRISYPPPPPRRKRSSESTKPHVDLFPPSSTSFSYTKRTSTHQPPSTPHTSTSKLHQLQTGTRPHHTGTESPPNAAADVSRHRTGRPSNIPVSVMRIDPSKPRKLPKAGPEHRFSDQGVPDSYPSSYSSKVHEIAARLGVDLSVEDEYDVALLDVGGAAQHAAGKSPTHSPHQPRGSTEGRSPSNTHSSTQLHDNIRFQTSDDTNMPSEDVAPSNEAGKQQDQTNMQIGEFEEMQDDSHQMTSVNEKLRKSGGSGKGKDESHTHSHSNRNSNLDRNNDINDNDDNYIECASCSHPHLTHNPNTHQHPLIVHCYTQPGHTAPQFSSNNDQRREEEGENSSEERKVMEWETRALTFLEQFQETLSRLERATSMLSEASTRLLEVPQQGLRASTNSKNEGTYGVNIGTYRQSSTGSLNNAAVTTSQDTKEPNELAHTSRGWDEGDREVNEKQRLQLRLKQIDMELGRLTKL